MKVFYKILQVLTKNPKMNNIQVLFWLFDTCVLKFIRTPNKDEKKRVLVIYTHALGDLVMFLGNVEYLKEIFSGYEITILCNSQYEELAREYFDKIIAIDFQKTSLNLLYRIAYLKIIRSYYYEYALDPIETTTYAPNLFAAHAIVSTNKIGIDIDKKSISNLIDKMREKTYTDLVSVSSYDHRIKNFSDFFSVIYRKKLTPIITRLTAKKVEELPENYCIIFPSASMEVKRWSVERFALIANRICKEYKLPIVCCGTSLDKDVVEEFMKMLSYDVHVIDMVGETSVVELINLVGNASLVVTNDTSIYHVALATRRKTCIVAGEYTYDSFLDYSKVDLNNELSLEIASGNMSCRNCIGNCSKKINHSYPCLDIVSTDTVWNCVRRLLSDVE